MKKIEQKLILFLANPDISDSEFSELAHSLESRQVQRILSASWEIRKQLDREARDFSSSKEMTPVDIALRDIERMLILEARIPKGAAIQMLADRLNYIKILPSRISFRDAVFTFLHEFDPSKVLSAAHQIRNKHVHDRHSHGWPLEENK